MQRRILCPLLIVIVSQVLCAKADDATSSLFSCVDWDCEDWISRGKTLLTYVGKTEKHLSFKKNVDIYIVGKPVDKTQSDWVGKVGNKVGLVPKDYVREDKMSKSSPKFKILLHDIPAFANSEENDAGEAGTEDETEDGDAEEDVKIEDVGDVVETQPEEEKIVPTREESIFATLQTSLPESFQTSVQPSADDASESELPTPELQHPASSASDIMSDSNMDTIELQPSTDTVLQGTTTLEYLPETSKTVDDSIDYPPELPASTTENPLPQPSETLEKRSTDEIGLGSQDEGKNESEEDDEDEDIELEGVSDNDNTVMVGIESQSEEGKTVLTKQENVFATLQTSLPETFQTSVQATGDDASESELPTPELQNPPSSASDILSDSNIDTIELQPSIDTVLQATTTLEHLPETSKAMDDSIGHPPPEHLVSSTENPLPGPSEKNPSGEIDTAGSQSEENPLPKPSEPQEKKTSEEIVPSSQNEEKEKDEDEDDETEEGVKLEEVGDNTITVGIENQPDEGKIVQIKPESILETLQTSPPETFQTSVQASAEDTLKSEVPKLPTPELQHPPSSDSDMLSASNIDTIERQHSIDTVLQGTTTLEFLPEASKTVDDSMDHSPELPASTTENPLSEPLEKHPSEEIDTGSLEENPLPKPSEPVEEKPSEEIGTLSQNEEKEENKDKDDEHRKLEEVGDNDLIGLLASLDSQSEGEKAVPTKQESVLANLQTSNAPSSQHPEKSEGEVKEEAKIDARVTDTVPEIKEDHGHDHDEDHRHHHHHHHHHHHGHRHHFKDINDTESSSIILVIKHLSSTLLSFLPEALQDTILDVDDALVFTGIIALTLVSICVPYFLIEGYMSVRPLKKKVVELNKSLWKVSAAYETQQEEFEIFKQKAIAHDEYKRRAEQSENDVVILKKLETKHREQITALKTQLKSQMKEAVDIRALIEKTLEDKRVVVEECEKYKTAYESTKETLVAAKEELSRVQHQAKSSSLLLNRSGKNTEVLTAKVSMLEEQAEEMKSQLAAENEKRKAVEIEKQEVEQAKAVVEKELAEFKNICHQYEETVSGLNDEISKLETELSSVKEMLGDDSPLLDIAEAQAKAAFLEKESGSLRTRLDGLTADNDNLNAKLKETTVALEEARAEREQTNNRLQVLEKYFKEREEELIKNIEQLELKESVRDKGKEELIRIIEEKDNVCKDLEIRLEALKEEFEETKQQHRNEIRAHEAKSHENWLSLCQAERKAQDARKEAKLLRQRLTALSKEKDDEDGDGLNGEVPMFPVLPDELVPLPILDDPPSYFGLGDFVPPPPLPEGEPHRPPPLGGLGGRLSPSFSDLDDNILSPIGVGRREDDCTDGSSGSESPRRSPPLRGSWVNAPHDREGQGRESVRRLSRPTSSPIQPGANL